MPLSFCNDSVTVLRAVVRTKNGMEYQDWESASSKTLSNVLITVQTTSRDFDDRVLQISDRRTLRAAYDADIQAGDRIVWNGETYDIEGDVLHIKSPTGRVSSTRCTLVRFKG